MRCVPRRKRKHVMPLETVPFALPFAPAVADAAWPTNPSTCASCSGVRQENSEGVRAGSMSALWPPASGAPGAAANFLFCRRVGASSGVLAASACFPHTGRGN